MKKIYLLFTLAIVNGCMNSAASNYNETATIEDGSCLYDQSYVDSAECPDVIGCMDPIADNYNPNATTIDWNSSWEDTMMGEPGCQYIGCLDETACNYNDDANDNDASLCTYNTFPGGVSASFNNYQTVNFPEGQDYYLLQPGYDYVAYESGSSSWIGFSATDAQGIPLGYGACCANSFEEAQTWYSNVAPELFISLQSYAFTSPGSYSFVASDDGCYSESFTIIVTDIPGCMDSTACNYDESATTDDDSCEFTSCLDLCGVLNGDNSTCTGCTYEYADEYDPTAIIDDGSCSENIACPGDFSGDGFVNVSDLGGFLGAFGESCE